MHKNITQFAARLYLYHVISFVSCSAIR